MKKLILLLFVFSLLITASIHAQEAPLPSSYTLQSETDYRQYESNVLASIQWLQNTPRNTNLAKRKQVEDFLIKWIYGTPYLKVVIEPYVMKLSGKNADLLVSFIFGYTAFKLQNITKQDALVANVAGIEFLINDYNTNNYAFKKDATIDHIIALQSTGKLTDWVNKQLNAVNLHQSDN